MPLQLPPVAMLNAPAALFAGQVPLGVPPLVIEPLVGTVTVLAGNSVLLAPSTRNETLV